MTDEQIRARLLELGFPAYHWPNVWGIYRAYGRECVDLASRSKDRLLQKAEAHAERLDNRPQP